MMVAQVGGKRKRLELWRPGGVEVMLLVVLIGVLVLPSLLVRGTSGPAFTAQERAIDQAESRGPIDTAQWQVRDLGFAKAEVPGVVRKVKLYNPSGQLGTEGTHVDAIVVGGHGAGVAIVKLPVDPSMLLEAQTDDLRALDEELGATAMNDFEMIDFHPRPERRYEEDQHVLDLAQAYAHDLATGEYSLRSEATIEGQTLRVRPAMVGRQPVLVVSLFPAGRPDTVIDRVTRSLRAS